MEGIVVVRVRDVVWERMMVVMKANVAVKNDNARSPFLEKIFSLEVDSLSLLGSCKIAERMHQYINNTKCT